MAHVAAYSTTACPYCIAAERFLKRRGVEQIEKILTDHEPEKREGMMARTGRHTVPRIYTGKRHIDGFDDLSVPDRESGLVPLLAA